MTEYVNEFNALSKYGPALISTPLEKNEKFVLGLNNELRDKLLTQLRFPFEEIVDMALRFEKVRERDSVSESQPTQNNKQQRKRPFFWKKNAKF